MKKRNPAGFPSPARLSLIIAIAILTFSCGNQPTDIYVSPEGNDSNPGTLGEPFASITKAREEARNISSPVNIVIRGGTYYLSGPVIFSPEDSRPEKAPLTIKSYAGEEVIISGAVPMKLKWSEYKNGIWQSRVDQDILFDQFYLNGKPRRMARYPNYSATAKIFGGVSADAADPEIVGKWQDPTGGYVHSIHPNEWGSYHYLIKGKNDRGELILEREAAGRSGQSTEGNSMEITNLTAQMHPDSRFVENIFEELDAVNEWFYNKSSRTLYYYPPVQDILSDGIAEFPQIESLVEFRGSEEEPVSGISLEGLTFTQTLRTFTKTSEKMSRGDWYIYRGGAIFMEGTENCNIGNCTFRELGGNAVFVNSYNRGVEVSGCLFENLGASAVCFCGHAGSRYDWDVPLDTVISHPGPVTNNYPSNCTVYDNLMYSLGTIEKQVAGVHISMAQGISVSHNTIYNVPRAGINVNDGMWGGHIIEYNDVFNTVLETADHGAFNSWGRDHDYFRDYSQMVELRDKVSRVTVLSNIIIRNNRFRCDHGWDIDLDDGSSHFHIYNNLCLNGGLKLREGIFRTVENNILVNNSLHAHVWYPNSDDVFTKNICTTPPYPIRMPEVWTKLIDYNIYLDPLVLKKAQVGGREEHSIYCPPDFADPASGDYRLKEGSPAFATGFKNFEMDKFGVVSGKLKELAQGPPLPELMSYVQDENAEITILGMKVKSVGVSERSAVAMFAEKGVFIIEIEEDSKFFGSLRPADVILQYQNREVNNLRDLQEAVLEPNWTDSIQLTIFRRGGGTSEITVKK